MLFSFGSWRRQNASRKGLELRILALGGKFAGDQLAQAEALDLPRSGARNLGNAADPLGTLESRQLGLAGTLRRVDGGLRVSLGGDEKRQTVESVGVDDRHASGLGDQRLAGHRLFNLGGL